MIIGITGTNGSGKDTFAEYLIKKGFVHFSLSDILREEAKKRNIAIERETLINIGNELRRKYGENVLASMTMDKIKKQNIKNTIITSIRNPGEILELRKNRDFVMVGLDAEPEVRYKRIVARARPEERKMSLQEFMALEEKEKTAEKNKQQLNVCLKMADKIITNNSSYDNFHRKIDKWMSSLKL